MAELNKDLQAKFWAAHEKVEGIKAKAKAPREAYDAKRNELADRERKELTPLKKKMTEAEAGLYEAQLEVAAYARALGGKTGPNPKGAAKG